MPSSRLLLKMAGKTAAAYENGCGSRAVHGGGVRQIATTLYDAALQAENGKITQRQNHSMIVTYVKLYGCSYAGTYKDIKIQE